MPGGARDSGQRGFFQAHPFRVLPAHCPGAMGEVLLGGACHLLESAACRQLRCCPRGRTELFGTSRPSAFSQAWPTGQAFASRSLVLSSSPWSLSTGQPTEGPCQAKGQVGLWCSRPTSHWEWDVLLLAWPLHVSCLPRAAQDCRLPAPPWAPLRDSSLGPPCPGPRPCPPPRFSPLPPGAGWNGHLVAANVGFNDMEWGQHALLPRDLVGPPVPEDRDQLWV